jgi:hypothetical protein
MIVGASYSDKPNTEREIPYQKMMRGFFLLAGLDFFVFSCGRAVLLFTWVAGFSMPMSSLDH